MRISQKFYDFTELLNSKYNYINTVSSEVIDEGEDWRIFLKKDILKYVRGIRDYNLKELCILFADDFLSKKADWSDFLIEKAVLKTNSGGSLFYERLESFLENRDAEMSKCYLVALKFGFTGYKKDPLKNDYENYLMRFKSYSKLKNDTMLQQYEGDMVAHNSYKLIGSLSILAIMIIVPLIVKIYYIIITFNHLNNCYLQWGY